MSINKKFVQWGGSAAASTEIKENEFMQPRLPQQAQQITSGKTRTLAEIQTQIDRAAEQLQSQRGNLTKEQATAEYLERNPALYAEYKRAHQVNAFKFQAGLTETLG